MSPADPGRGEPRGWTSRVCSECPALRMDQTPGPTDRHAQDVASQELLPPFRVPPRTHSQGPPRPGLVGGFHPEGQGAPGPLATQPRPGVSSDPRPPACSELMLRGQGPGSLPTLTPHRLPASHTHRLLSVPDSPLSKHLLLPCCPPGFLGEPETHPGSRRPFPAFGGLFLAECGDSGAHVASTLLREEKGEKTPDDLGSCLDPG